jgi:hypothetical protein
VRIRLRALHPWNGQVLEGLAAGASDADRCSLGLMFRIPLQLGEGYVGIACACTALCDIGSGR